MSFLDRFRAGSGLLCPRCEKPLADHDEEKCAQKMTRRNFFGMWGAAIAVGCVGGKILIATPNQVAAIEKELGGSTWMTSMKDGRIVTSHFEGDTGHASHIIRRGSGYQRRYHKITEEVLQLRGKGFSVQIASDLDKHKSQYRKACRDSVNRVDFEPDSEFPSVYRW